MTKEKKLLATLLSGVVIVSGIITGFSKPTGTLTFEETELLINIYNYELKKINLNNLNFKNQEDFIQKLNDLILNRNITENTIQIKDYNFSKNDYSLLRDYLIKKSDRKSLFEKIIK